MCSKSCVLARHAADPLSCGAATLSLLPSDPAPLAVAKFAVAAVLAGSTVMLFGLGILVAAVQEE